MLALLPPLRAALALCASSALVAGCGGSARGGSASGALDFVVSGQAAYERPLVDPVTATLAAITTRQAIRHARVDVLSGGVVVASGATDGRGAFRVTVPGALEGAGLDLRVEARSALAWAPVAVAGHDGVVHALASVGPVTSAAPVDLLAATRPLAGAFNILGQTLRGLEVVRAVEPDLRLPALAVVWTPEGPNRTATTFDPARMTLEVLDDPLADTDCFDDAVLLHELGHYLQAACSADSTPGGEHHPGQDLDLRLAFAEGWATAFAQTVLGDPLHVDTRVGGGLVSDVERPSASSLGAGSESAIHGLLWDLVDGAGGPASTDPDGVSLGFAPLWRAMRALRGAPHAYVRDLRDALLAAGALTARDWDAVAAPLGLAAPLPDLGPALAHGAQAQGVVNAALGQDSLRAASAYCLVTVAGGGLSVTLDATDELDLLLDAPDGARFASRNDGAPERIDLPFATPGAYLVRVQARGGVIGSAQAAFTLATR